MKKLYLDSLSIYTNIMNDNTLSTLYRLLSILEEPEFDVSEAVRTYGSLYNQLLNKSMPLKEYIINLILFDSNPFTWMSETNEMDENIVKAATTDIENLYHIMNIESAKIKEFIINTAKPEKNEELIILNLPPWEKIKFNSSNENLKSMINSLRDLNKSFETIKILSNFHKNNGSGIFAEYKASICRLKNENLFFEGIEYPDPVRLSDLIGYKEQKRQVLENTESFLKGYTANNILLYGDRGTGKSSTVKALLNEYSSQGLRIIEVPKNLLVRFPDIVRALRTSRLKFIVFVDDLAFEDNEESYTALKASLEGGVEYKPSNVLIYATSNRKHLVKERFSERAGLTSSNIDDEIRAGDTIQEKLSLADRFGMTVVYSSPDKKGYLEIVKGILNKRNIYIHDELLEREAMKWELRYNGRSPRTAKQFADWICSSKKAAATSYGGVLRADKN